MNHVARVALALVAFLALTHAFAQTSPGTATTSDGPVATEVEPSAAMLWNLLGSAGALEIELPGAVRGLAAVGLHRGSVVVELDSDRVARPATLRLTVGALPETDDQSLAFIEYKLTDPEGLTSSGGASIGRGPMPAVPSFGSRLLIPPGPGTPVAAPLDRWLPVHAVRLTDTPMEAGPDRSLVFYLYLSEAPLEDVPLPLPEFIDWHDLHLVWRNP